MLIYVITYKNPGYLIFQHGFPTILIFFLIIFLIWHV